MSTAQTNPSDPSNSVKHELSPEDLATAVDRARELLSPLDADIRDRAERLVKAKEAFIAAGVRAMVKKLKSDERSKEVLFELVDDPIVYAVLMDLGIVKPDIMTRVARAMERIKPYIKGHGGDIELVKVENGTAFVRMHGSCSGCSMSAATLSDGVEEAIKAHVPEIHTVEEIKDGPVAGVVQLTVGGTDESHGWVEGPRAKEIEEGVPFRFQSGDSDILLVRRDDRLFAYRNECPHQGLSLHDGHLSGDTITCPWHGYCFDVTNGECENQPQVQLEPFPLRIENDTIWVRPDGAKK